MLRRYVRPQDIPVVIALQVIVFTLSLASKIVMITSQAHIHPN